MAIMKAAKYLIDLNYVTQDETCVKATSTTSTFLATLSTRSLVVSDPLIRSDVEIANASSEAMQVNSQEEIQGASDTEMEGGN